MFWVIKAAGTLAPEPWAEVLHSASIMIDIPSVHAELPKPQNTLLAIKDQ